MIKADNVSNILTKIKNAQPSEKRILINKLKVMLRSENIQTRKQVFNRLRKSQNKHNINHNNKNFNNKTLNTTHLSNMKTINSSSHLPKSSGRKMGF